MAQLVQDRDPADTTPDELRNAPHVSPYPASWFIEDEEPVAQSVNHQRAEFRLQSILLAWQKRTKQDDLLIGCELACRWDESHPKVGVDPDIYIIEKPPPDPETGNTYSLRTWEPGNLPPILAIEIVSDSRLGKDYGESPEKHDKLGTFELWVFDPDLRGGTKTRKPARLQIFQRATNNNLVRVHAGAGPFRSDVLDAWVMVIGDDVVIANDFDARERWPTLEEEEQRHAIEQAKLAAEFAKRAEEAAKRADEEAKRADAQAKLAADQAKRADEEAKRADVEKAEKEAALARIAELEALLAQQR